MAGPEQEAVALLSGTGMGPVLATALSPASDQARAPRVEALLSFLAEIASSP